jgi:hypothetical protein
MSTYMIQAERELVFPYNTWIAWFGGQWEWGDPKGKGPTEAAAIADLLANNKAPWGDA